MRRFVFLSLCLALVAGCAPKQEEGGKKGGSSSWPEGLYAHFTPENRIIRADAKLRVWMEDKTGKGYKFEWVAEGLCGELKVDKNKTFEALFIGGKHTKDCTEKLTLKAAGPSGVVEKGFNIKVLGSAEFATLQVRPDPIPESWLMINDYDKTMEGREVKCVHKLVGDGARAPTVGLAVDAVKKRKKSRDQEEKEAKAKTGKQEAEVEDIYDDVQLNVLGAPFGPWNFEFANCSFGETPKEDEGALAFRYDLPHDDDYCGYFENLSIGRDCETGQYDTSIYESLTFIAKSGDGQKHKIYAEMINWEKFAEFHRAAPKPWAPTKSVRNGPASRSR